VDEGGKKKESRSEQETRVQEEQRRSEKDEEKRLGAETSSQGVTRCSQCEHSIASPLISTFQCESKTPRTVAQALGRTKRVLMPS
jgi:hypothetical protein